MSRFNINTHEIPSQCVQVGSGVFEYIPDEPIILHTGDNFTIKSTGRVIWGIYNDPISNVDCMMISDGDGHVSLFIEYSLAKIYNWDDFVNTIDDIENEIFIPADQIIMNLKPLSSEYATAVRILGNWIIFFDRLRNF